MRALLAATLALALALAAFVPHVHDAGHGSEACAVCVVRGGDVAHAQTPDVAPAERALGEAPALPVASPVYGAPLGAVPGQSPPRA